METKEYSSTYIRELSQDPIILQMISQLKSNIGERIAYPNTDQYMAIPGAHDTQKWLQTIKEVYYGERNGLPRSHALRQATSNWKVTEVYDFLNWLRFYEEGTHLKYKSAQFYYGNADVGYLLPIKQDSEPTKETSVSGKDIDFARESAADEMPASEKKRIIERQRHKIIGRLDSAEKLLRSNEGQLFADKELSSLLEAIYELKKKVQLLNKKSSSTTIYEDMIIREANILNRKGFVKAADMLYSLADDPGKTNNPPTPAPPAPPAEGSGSASGQPATAPGSPEVPAQNNTPSAPATAPAQTSAQTVPPIPPPSAPEKPKKPTAPGLEQFKDNLNTGGSGKSDFKDLNSIEDTLEVMDADDDLVVEAQAEPAPPPPPIPEAPKEPVTNAKPPSKDIEVKEEEAVPAETPSKDVDKMLGAVFSNLTISDVVAKFEDIAKFYKTREMPRQLAMADMMLDSLGLAPFFPALSEATNKALEANNYISSRIEDILSKLRGTMKTREIDMKDEGAKTVSPEVEKAKQSLKEQDESEKAKKQMRKDLEDKALQDQMKETPEIEVEEDLGGEAPPAPPAPATKPTV